MNAPPVVLKEEVDVRLLSSLSANFTSAREALFELVDNALASRIADKPVRVMITGSRWSRPGGRIKVVSKGGQGMGPDGLRQFLKWGKRPEVTGLNRYGQGGKAAIGYLGTGVRIRANAAGSDIAYEFEDSDWLARPNGQEKEYVATPVSPVEPGVGTVEIEIFNLKKTINAKKLEQELAWRYRPALVENTLRLRLKNRTVRPVSLSADAREEFDHQLVAQTYENPEGEQVRLRGWVGIASSEFDGRGGVRCSAYGRVIVPNEYFGHRNATYKASLSSLIGEVDLSFVSPVLNKSDFDRDDPAWQAAQQIIFREMDPFIKRLLQRKDSHEPSDQERYRAMEAKDIAHRALDRIAEEAGHRGTAGRRSGRKPPSRSEDGGRTRPESSATQEKERNPQTPPPPEAVGRLRRKGMSLDWDVRALDAKIRSAISEERGRVEIVINNRYPLYRQRDGDLAYMLETGLLEELKPNGSEDKSVAEYHEQVAEAMYWALAPAR